MNIGPEILIVLFLILLNGFFAMSETAILASRKARLQQRANEGDVKARQALNLAENPNRFLPTVQIGITLIGVLTGALGGAVFADPLAAEMDRIPALLPYAHSVSLAIVVILITFFSMLVGELVPKRLGFSARVNAWRAFASPSLARCWRRALRLARMAVSDMAKKPFRRMRNKTINISRPMFIRKWAG